MKLNVEGRLRIAIRCAFAASGIGVVASPVVLAQDAVQLQGIEVTGSHIRRVDTATADTVQVLDRKQIEATGAATLAQLIQSVPAVTGSATNSQANNDPNVGASPFGNADINLRGLGAVRTLLLLDGNRINYQDINSIPANMIERVEVLKEGASAIYGTDAIGGVVNFISRKNFNGLEATGGFGETQYGDAQTTTAELTFGRKVGGGNVMFGLNWNRQTGIKATDRTYSAHPFGFYYGGLDPNSFTSSRAPGGRFFLPHSLGGRCSSVTLIPGTDGSSSADFRCFVNSFAPGATDRFNFQPYNLDLDPSERYSLFGNASIPVTENIKWYAEAYFTDTSALFSLAPVPFDNATIGGVFVGANPKISANNIYNPFGVDISSYAKRATAAGGRINHGVSDAYQASTGFKGTLLDRFDWTVGFNYGVLDQTQSESGLLDFSNILEQLGPSFINAQGNPQCGTPAAPVPTATCTPINVFGTRGANLSALAVTAVQTTRQDTVEFVANIDGDLFTLPAGPVGAAAGFDYRNLHFLNNPDAIAQAFHLDEQNSKSTAGEYSVRELYAETHVPVLKDLPAVKSLSLDLGVRAAFYSTFGSTTDGKYAFEYKPYSDLLLRGAYNDVYRAPNTSELFGGATQSAPGYSDPCNGATAATLAAHPIACANVPVGFQQANSQASTVTVGNPALNAEKGYATNFGAVFNPSFYKPLTLEIDYWRYSIKNYITGISLQTILGACFANEASPFCGISPDGQPWFVRANDGNIANAQQLSVNSDKLYTSGWDFSANLNYPKVHFGDTNLGGVQVGVTVTYLSVWDYKSFDPSNGALLGDFSLAGQADTGNVGRGFGLYPRVRGQAFLFWTYGPFTTMVADRYVGGLRDPGADQGSGADVQIGYTSYLDVAETYKFKPWNTDFTVGINDVADEGIQPLYNGGYTGAPSTFQDARGRNFYGRVTVRFK